MNFQSNLFHGLSSCSILYPKVSKLLSNLDQHFVVLQEEGLQQLETFLYTVRKINENDSILPGIKLGVLGLDGCDSSSHVLEVAMDFMDGFIASNQNLRQQLQCEKGKDLIYNGNFSRLVGVVGGRSSRVSIQLANLLRVFQVPQVKEI